ncbi:head decoration protein [Ochrobactrum sp. S1502_03]|uniref:head decoration protein n=1 Tax=Ochrobactrum sp. S1502_03 TaxID=3108451 RepID=UPI0037C78B9E
MENKVMGLRPLEFILHEGDGHISRDVATIPAGTGKLKPGTVLGELTAAKGSFIPSPAGEIAGQEGAETATAILCYAADATDNDAEAVIINVHAEVKTSLLVFDASVNDAAKQAAKLEQLRAVHIKAR